MALHLRSNTLWRRLLKSWSSACAAQSVDSACSSIFSIWPSTFINRKGNICNCLRLKYIGEFTIVSLKTAPPNYPAPGRVRSFENTTLHGRGESCCKRYSSLHERSLFSVMKTRLRVTAKGPRTATDSSSLNDRSQSQAAPGRPAATVRKGP